MSSVKDNKEKGELMKSENDQLKKENEEMRKEKKNLETGKDYKTMVSPLSIPFVPFHQLFLFLENRQLRNERRLLRSYRFPVYAMLCWWVCYFLSLFGVEMSDSQREQELNQENARLTTALQSLSGSSFSNPLLFPSRNAMLIVPLASEAATHAFLTHAWGRQSDNYENHRLVGKIYSELKTRYNMKMWFDQDYIQGSIVDEIIAGMSHTKCMIVFLTKQYEAKIIDEKEGKFCKLEFDHALTEFGHDRLIPVIMEEEMLNPVNWSKKVSVVFGSTKFIDFTGLSTMTEERLSEKCEELFQLVMKRTK
jgi:hypothetical protein